MFHNYKNMINDNNLNIHNQSIKHSNGLQQKFVESNLALLEMFFFTQLFHIFQESNSHFNSPPLSAFLNMAKEPLYLLLSLQSPKEHPFLAPFPLTDISY